MPEAERYTFTTVDAFLGEAGVVPLLPFVLINGSRLVNVFGLLDTGASVNVLPYPIGQNLGAIWEDCPILTQLGGNLGHYEARGLMLSVRVGSFPLTRLVFAWSEAPDIPVILGQMNFFMEYDVCFFRSQLMFEIKPKGQ